MREGDARNDRRPTLDQRASNRSRYLPPVIVALLLCAAVALFMLPPSTGVASILFYLLVSTAGVVVCVWVVLWLSEPLEAKLAPLNGVFIWLLCTAAAEAGLPLLGVNHELRQLGPYLVDPLAAAQIAIALVFLLIWLIFVP